MNGNVAAPLRKSELQHLKQAMQSLSATRDARSSVPNLAASHNMDDWSLPEPCGAMQPNSQVELHAGTGAAEPDQAGLSGFEANILLSPNEIYNLTHDLELRLFDDAFGQPEFW